MKRIMFVCHGNICRSPMAEFIFKRLLSERGVSEQFFVSSSATSTEEIYRGVGNPVYPPARRILLKHGLDPGDKRAVLLLPEDRDKYDMFIGMDERNISGMKRILGKGAEDKIYKLLSFKGRSETDVPDPWYTGDFDGTYELIYDGCLALLDSILDRS